MITLRLLQRDLGDYISALLSTQRALKIRLEVLGENHPYTACSYNTIEVTQHQLGDYTSALQSHQRVLEIWLESLVENHQDTACSYNTIEVTQHQLGDYTSALQSHQRVLEIWLESLVENHPDTAVSYTNIATLPRDLGDYIFRYSLHLLFSWKSGIEMMGYFQVLKSYQRALGITREILGDNHLLTADCHYHIGSTQRSLIDYTSALQSYKRAQ